MDNYNKFLEYREKYPEFIYEGYDIEKDDEYLNITYHFNTVGLTTFSPKLKIKLDNITIEYNEEYLDYLVFQIGLIEIMSYVKATCSPLITIKCNYINDEQIKFLKKLYFNGLGEFLYVNGINTEEEKVSMDELFTIKCDCPEYKLPEIEYMGNGNLICVGGGKDSCVSLELLKNEENNTCFIINGKTPSIGSCRVALYDDSEIINVSRVLDRRIVELNNLGYLNGHTPFSSIVAFITYLVAYLNGKKNIILSNESSANQSTVIGTNINHQYSKTYEFEKDFMEYCDKFIGLPIKYFSLLRGLSEFNIARLFSNYTKFHKVFKSCNVGSKEKEWVWCCNCSKCLFVYIILSPFLSLDDRINIFGEDLYEREDLLDTFIEILGYSDTKPFECVGTYEEARYAVSLVINNGEDSSYLLKYYKEHYELELDGSIINKYNDINNLDDYYNDLVKKELSKYV